MRKPERFHIFPIDGRGKTKHVIDHDDGMCWCKPIDKQVCSEADERAQCEDGCWRCAGEGVCDIYDPTLNTLLIHRANGVPCYPAEGATLQWVNENAPGGAAPHRCPICGGRGQVPAGFYGPASQTLLVISTEPEKCKSCDGEGVVWG